MFKKFCVFIGLAFMILAQCGALKRVELYPEIYPYQNTVDLLAYIETRIEDESDCALGIMPLVLNRDDPNFLLFIDVLLYAQSYKMPIFLHLPLNAESLETQVLIETLRSNIWLYQEKGIRIQGLLLTQSQLSLFEEVLESEFTLYIYQDLVIDEMIIDDETLIFDEGEVSYFGIIEKENDEIQGVYDLSFQNQIYFIIVIIAIGIFSGMIIYARYMNKRRFIRHDKEAK
ncbi:MAG: hypothetical protein R3Y57_05700 [Erysipelotrichaceae bacterium]